jgi:hypothetical protein
MKTTQRLARTALVYKQYSDDIEKMYNTNRTTLQHQQNMDIDSTGIVQIRCMQINLQHSKSATNNLLKITDTVETDIIFAQKPCVFQNRPEGFGKKYRVFTAGTGKHRTAIIIRNNIDAIPP